jgi:hypothetical protein
MPLSLTGGANSWLVGSASVLQKNLANINRPQELQSYLSSFAACKEISFDMAAACAADIVDWLPPHTHTQKQTNKQTKERIPKIQNNIIITTHVAVII